MNKWFITSIVACCAALSGVDAVAQPWYNLDIKPVYWDGTVFDVKLSISGGFSAFNLGTSIVVMSFSGPIENPRLLTAHNFSGGNYAGIAVSSPQDKQVAVSVTLLTTPGTQVPTNPYTAVATIRFDVTDPYGSASMQFVFSGTPHTEVRDDASNVGVPFLMSIFASLPVPVELTSFTGARATDGVVGLAWRTASEKNCTGFDVQRSFDKRTWNTLGFVEGNGTANVPHSYTYFDASAAADASHAVVYYRLRQEDRDGTSQFSPIVEVAIARISTAPVLHAPYPNPARASSAISVTLPSDDRVTLSVADNLGRIVQRYCEDEPQQAGGLVYAFHRGGLPAGLYHVVLQTRNGTLRQPLLVME